MHESNKSAQTQSTEDRIQFIERRMVAVESLLEAIHMHVDPGYRAQQDQKRRWSQVCVLLDEIKDRPAMIVPFEREQEIRDTANKLWHLVCDPRESTEEKEEREFVERELSEDQGTKGGQRK